MAARNGSRDHKLCYLSNIRAWIAANLMMMNSGKTELAVSGTRPQHSKLDTLLIVKCGDEIIILWTK